MARTESVSVQMEELLDDVSKRVKGVMKESIKQTAVESAQKLRNTSPVKTGSYSKGWKAGKQRGDDYVVHNATDYQLTHLLENGHIIRNKKGTYGRTHPIKHIKPVEEWASDELPRKVDRGLSNL